MFFCCFCSCRHLVDANTKGMYDTVATRKSPNFLYRKTDLRFSKAWLRDIGGGYSRLLCRYPSALALIIHHITASTHTFFEFRKLLLYRLELVCQVIVLLLKVIFLAAGVHTSHLGIQLRVIALERFNMQGPLCLLYTSPSPRD